MIGTKLTLTALLVIAAAVSMRCGDLLGSEGGDANPMSALNALGAISGKSIVAPTKSQDKTEVKPGDPKDEGILGVSNPVELVQLLLNPFEFCTKVVSFFKLQFDQFFPLVSKGVSFGLELALQPVLITLKIIETIFVPDECKLKFVCKLAQPLSFSKDLVPKLSDKVLTESKVFKAFNDGVQGCDCETQYSCGGQPKLKEEFKEGQQGGAEGQQQTNGAHQEGDGGEPNYAASNLLKSFNKTNKSAKPT